MKKLLFSLLLIPLLLMGCVTTENRGLNMLLTTLEATSKAARPISDEEEYYVGRAVAARILSPYILLEDRSLTEYVNLIGQTIAMHSDRPFTHGGYHFAILDTDEVNAFACPGGMIFITKGMINLTGNEDELASVIAHEIAHVNHRDGISSIKSARWTEALTIIGTEAAKQYGSAELSRLVSIFEGSIDDVFKTLVVSGYSQSQEYMADETAVVYLTKTGYNPSALKDFLGQLINYGYASRGGILKTHPGTEKRMENVSPKIPPSEVDPSLIELRCARYDSVLK